MALEVDRILAQEFIADMQEIIRKPLLVSA